MLYSLSSSTCWRRRTGLGGLHLFGARLDLLFSVPAAVALFETPAVGAAVGLMTGILYDLAGTGVEGLLPLYFMLFATFAAAISGRYLRRIWPSHLLLTAGGCSSARHPVCRGGHFGTGLPGPAVFAVYVRRDPRRHRTVPADLPASAHAGPPL